MTEGSPIAPDFEPKPCDRVWYRNATNGDHGWRVRSDGKDYIRLDRGASMHYANLRPFREGDWIMEAEHRPMTVHQLAGIAFVADTALCKALGLHALSKREWHGLPDDVRVEWMKNGPDEGAERKVLYRAIMDGMVQFAG